MTQTEIRGQRSEVKRSATRQIRVAVLFERLGPYHHARLNAAGKLMQVIGMEACAVDETYAWEKIEGADSFVRLTLTERYGQRKQGRVAQVSSPAGSGCVPPPASGSCTETGPEPAAETVALRAGSWKRELQRQIGLALDEARPQAVAVPGWSSPEALSALSWCVQTRTPAIMMSESTEWDGQRSSWKEWMKRRLVGLCSAALVGGTSHKDYMVKLEMPAKRVFLGYDAVDNGYFEAEAAKWRKQKVENRNQPSEVAAHFTGQGGKNEFQLSTFPIPAFRGAPFFLASARFVEKKNLPRLLQAFARYRELAAQAESKNQKVESKNEFQLSAFPISAFGKPWHLVLLGDGPLKPDLCHLISDLRLQDSVLLPGFKQYEELPVYYALASAFVHASTTEQWGLVVNEAMASGLPVLVSNRCGCATDLVKDGVNGFTFDPYNVEQFAGLMLKISAFNFPLSAFGSKSREIISQWGPERFASGLQQAVETALRVPPPQARLLDRLLLKALLAR